MIWSFLQRVRLILAAKKIPNEEINIHLKQRPTWFYPDINPYGLVPVIEHNGHLIRESRIAFGKYIQLYTKYRSMVDTRVRYCSFFTADYIDSAFEGPSLWPADPYKRAMDQLLVDDFGSKVNHSH